MTDREHGRLREFTYPGELDLDYLEQLEQAGWRVSAAPGKVIQLGLLRATLVDEFFGRVKWGAYSKAVKNLIKADRLVREERKAAALRDDERLSLPSSGEPARTDSRAKVVPIRAA